MNILIVGLGEVGSHLAKVLTSEGQVVSVVDPDHRRLQRVAETCDVKAVHGDGSRPDVLDKADAHASDLILAVSNNDSVNMLTCLFGKRMGAKKTVLRLKDMAPFRRARTFFRKNLGYDLLLSLEDLAAEEIVKILRENQAVGVENFAEGKIQMRRLRLLDSSMLEVPVKDLKIPSGALITAIHRDHDVVIPGGNDVLHSGDEVFVLGTQKAVLGFEKKAGVEATSLRSVVISGSSGIVSQVCKAMHRLHVGTRVIVEDRAQAERLSESLEGVVVLHADATDLGFLQEEHIGDADAFLGISRVDERNLMSCQLARNLGVRRTVALVQKPDYVSLYEQLGIDVAVSPRLLCANRILSFVRSRSISTIATIVEGKAEVLEVEVPIGSKLVGKALKNAKFPRGCVVGALARADGEIVIPRGEDVIQALDNLVLFVLNNVIDQVLVLVGAQPE